MDRRTVWVADLGLTPYHEAWDLQHRLQEQRIAPKLARNRDRLSPGHGGETRPSPSAPLHDVLLLTEHPPVYTLGKSAREEHLLIDDRTLERIGATVVRIDRGGDITYHGPGQVVGYPILDLDHHFTDIHRYLRTLEEVIIRVCADFGVKAGRIDGLTGVWVEDRKICAFGVRCSRWVTMHGFALNVSTDLSYFDHIVPCGIRNKRVTSLHHETGGEIATAEVHASIATHFGRQFGVDLRRVSEAAIAQPVS